MENPTDNLNEQQPLVPESLTINTEIKNYLFETAKWGRFLGILGFILVGLMVLAAFGMGLFMDRFQPGMNPAAGMGGQAGGIFFTVFYLLFAVMYYFPSMYIYQFSGKAKAALLGNSETELTFAFSRLKSFFKFWGILSIVLMIFYGIVMIAFFAILALSPGMYK